MGPRVSVIIPIYNVERYIAECIESLLHQTFTDFEAICVDSGSSDRSIEIAREVAGDDSRFVFTESGDNGQSVARNRALDMVRGEYLLNLDSDDYYVSDTLERLVKESDASSLDMLYFSAKTFYETDDLSRTNPERQDNRPDIPGVLSGPDMYVQMEKTGAFRPSACMFMFKRSLVEEAGLRFVDWERCGYRKCGTVQLLAHILPVDRMASFMEAGECRPGKIVLKIAAGKTDIFSEVEGRVGVRPLVYPSAVKVIAHCPEDFMAERLLLLLWEEAPQRCGIRLRLCTQLLNKGDQGCLQFFKQTVNLLPGGSLFPFVHEPGYRISGEAHAADQFLLVGEFLLHIRKGHGVVVFRPGFRPYMFCLKIMGGVCGIEVFRHSDKPVKAAPRFSHHGLKHAVFDRCRLQLLQKRLHLSGCLQRVDLSSQKAHLSPAVFSGILRHRDPHVPGERLADVVEIVDLLHESAELLFGSVIHVSPVLCPV